MAWPKDVQLKLVNMNHVYYRALGMENQCIQPYEELRITIEVKLPSTLGKYLLNFRLVHGNNIEFGDAVSVYLLSQSQTDKPVLSTPCMPIEYNVTSTPERPLLHRSGHTARIELDLDDGTGEPVDDHVRPVNTGDDEVGGRTQAGTETHDTKGLEIPDTTAKILKQETPPVAQRAGYSAHTPKRKEFQRHTSTN